tara:strand:+ start:193 stop:942 length:750 start_codon:yes stop_codon:yes gene_type:complete
MNNNLIIFLENGTKKKLSFPLNDSEEKAIEKMNEIYGHLKIKKYFYLPHDEKYLDIESYSLDNFEKLKVDERISIIRNKMLLIRRKRDLLLKELDLSFMRSLEDDCKMCTEKIVELKKFLRDLPQKLRFDEIEDIEDLKDYNPFNNIFDIHVIQRGKEYKTPPNIKVLPPSDQYFGFEAKAVAEIENGSIKNIKVIDPGCGYARKPTVIIAPPFEGAPPSHIGVASAGLPQNATEDLRGIAMLSDIKID